MHGIASGLAKGLAPVLAGLQTYRRGPGGQPDPLGEGSLEAFSRPGEGVAVGNATANKSTA